MKEKMKVDKEFMIPFPIRKIVFKIPVANIKWRCCISGDEISDSFLEIRVKPDRNYTVEFMNLMKLVVDSFREKAESSECTIAEELVVFIKNKLMDKYPHCDFKVKLVFLERDRETGLVAVVEVEA